MGLVRVPLVSMRTFLTTWGICAIGANSIIMAKTISTEYGILTWFDDSISKDDLKSGSTWTIWTMVFLKLFWQWGGNWLEKCSPTDPKLRWHNAEVVNVLPGRVLGVQL